MFVCPVRRRPLEGWRSPSGREYPLFQGIPVLAPEPEALLPPSGSAPPPREVLSAFCTPDQLGLSGLGREMETPVSVCAAWGHALAPPGPAADLRCGLGAMALQMAARGRCTYALDTDAWGVSLARDLLLGGVREGAWQPWPGGPVAREPLPIVPLRLGPVRFAIARPEHPPLEAGRMAWVHLPDAGEALAAAAGLLMPGGLLTAVLGLDDVESAEEPGRGWWSQAVALGLEAVEGGGLREGVMAVERHHGRRWTVRWTQCLAVRRPTRERT